jgi:hypothetical protein
MGIRIAMVTAIRMIMGMASFVRELVGGVLAVLYWIRPTVHLAPRLSPVAAYGRLLLLYAAALSAPST